AALAEIIVAAAAVEAADAGLVPDAAAKARRTDDRADHLGPECGRHHAAATGGGGAAARPAGGARRVPRIARAAERLARGEFGGDGLAEDRRPGPPHRGGRRRVAPRLRPLPQRRALPGRHADGLDDVLDADRHT